MRPFARVLVTAGFCLVAAAPTPVAAQRPRETQTLEKQIEELRQGQAALRKELDDIKALLRGRVAEPREIVVGLGDVAALGDRNAPITIVEFSDYECPFCGRHARQTFPRLDSEYIRTGKVRYVFRNFPIESLHPHAFKAHEAAACANDQGKYWPLHERLFVNQAALQPAQLVAHAEALGLDMEKFRACFDSDRYAPAIRRDIAEAQKATVNSTPTFLIGKTDPAQSTITAVQVLRGAQAFERFKEVLDGLLSK